MAQKKIYGTIAFQSKGLKRQLYWQCPAKKCQHFFIIERDMTALAMRFTEDFFCAKCNCTYTAFCHYYTSKTITLLISDFKPGNPTAEYHGEHIKNI